MRYWTVIDPKDPVNGNFESEYTTYSEEEVLNEYWEYWYGRMCDKFGKEYVDENYGPEDCIEDWVIVNWAMESK
jgi:hypothetical protein